jgi:hypothetical protein
MASVALFLDGDQVIPDWRDDRPEAVLGVLEAKSGYCMHLAQVYKFIQDNDLPRLQMLFL